MDLTKPVDPVFTQSLPKVELHAHLSGSISRQCLHELWATKKAQDPSFSIEDPWVSMPPGKVDYSLQTFFQTFNKSIYHLVNDLPSLTYATTSVLTDFLNDGVTYLELRTIPRASPSAAFTREEYLTTVLDTIQHFQSSVSAEKMSVYLILAIDRGHSTASEALEIVDLALANRARGVVGIDVCGNPTKGDVSVFRDAFAKAKAHGLGVTVHFAETTSSGSLEELNTLLEFQPDRLGHVIHVPEEVKKEIARRRLGLELCISCNVHAKMFDGGFLDHHFGFWRFEDCPVVLCTDDVGFFCSPVSNEYLLVAEHFQLNRADLLSICRKSYDVIFGGESEKERLKRLLNDFEMSYSQ
ncbi:Metallo-dependent hydrolase [Aspergillus heteromorphus CBS 117.55]|uniref:Metallo-dependent hydrolase n=1 Tax=Aspergillus heteromorphus CBS 117.55 TaxID=1448321 RepID=A0A317VX11_9EURO|nr:Metallo-dependent hydrolase [Aspergillus heteromorphus CBS 117.55]PWY77512.1 Metallo-dependent hydrolase [Aspergillus heteromorphus CBS 117.55]